MIRTKYPLLRRVPHPSPPCEAKYQNLEVGAAQHSMTMHNGQALMLVVVLMLVLVLRGDPVVIALAKVQWSSGGCRSGG